MNNNLERNSAEWPMIVGECLPFDDLKQRVLNLLEKGLANCISTPSHEELRKNEGMPFAYNKMDAAGTVIVDVLMEFLRERDKNAPHDLMVISLNLNEQGREIMRQVRPRIAAIVQSEEAAELAKERIYLAMQDLRLQEAVVALKIMYEAGQFGALTFSTYGNLRAASTAFEVGKSKGYDSKKEIERMVVQFAKKYRPGMKYDIGIVRQKMGDYGVVGLIGNDRY